MFGSVFLLAGGGCRAGGGTAGRSDEEMRAAAFREAATYRAKDPLAALYGRMSRRKVVDIDSELATALRAATRDGWLVPAPKWSVAWQMSYAGVIALLRKQNLSLSPWRRIAGHLAGLELPPLSRGGPWADPEIRDGEMRDYIIVAMTFAGEFGRYLNRRGEPDRWRAVRADLREIGQRTVSWSEKESASPIPTYRELHRLVRKVQDRLSRDIPS